MTAAAFLAVIGVACLVWIGVILHAHERRMDEIEQQKADKLPEAK